MVKKLLIYIRKHKLGLLDMSSMIVIIFTIIMEYAIVMALVIGTKDKTSIII
jgi:hypothetical protein